MILNYRWYLNLKHSVIIVIQKLIFDRLFPVKLGGPLGTSMGPVMVYHSGKWLAVCDAGFNSLAARVVCRQLNFKDGKVNPGSAFGNITGNIGEKSFLPLVSLIKVFHT